MSTTTHQDKKAVKYLASLTGEDPEKLGVSLLEQGMGLTGVSLDVLLSRDSKLFTLSEKSVQIAQIMVPAFGSNRARDNEIVSALEKARSAAGLSLSLALFTSVLENASDIYGAGEAALLSEIFEESLPARLPGVMSRKKDFLPWLGERLKKVSRA